MPENITPAGKLLFFGALCTKILLMVGGIVIIALGINEVTNSDVGTIAAGVGLFCVGCFFIDLNSGEKDD